MSQCWLKDFLSEREELYRIRAYFQRYPEAESTLAKIDSLERRKLMDKLPHETEEDIEAVRYLQSHRFLLDRRLAFIEGEIAEYNNEVRAVSCPACQTGELYVLDEFTDSFFVGEETQYYTLSTMGKATDGKIRMHSSGWQGPTHWTGFHSVSPEEPDYVFWIWLLSQRENYPALVDDKQLAQIKEDWQNATR